MIRPHPSHPAANGAALAAYHAARAGHYRAEQLAALRRGDHAAVCRGYGDASRYHRASARACEVAVIRCATATPPATC